MLTICFYSVLNTIILRQKYILTKAAASIIPSYQEPTNGCISNKGYQRVW